MLRICPGGRFLQTDPVGYEDDLNLYAYVRNDPLNQADPTGLGVVRWFVQVIRRQPRRGGGETTRESWRELPRGEQQAQRARERGSNVRAEGPGSSRDARRVERENSGRENTVRHDPHADSGRGRREGETNPHYQPERRAGGERGRGHTSYKAGAAGALLVSSYVDQNNPDEAALGEALDFFNPFAAMVDLATLAAEGVTAFDESAPQQDDE
jgi:uncharacterized protein RhaS with RHS repeats